MPADRLAMEYPAEGEEQTGRCDPGDSVVRVLLQLPSCQRGGKWGQRIDKPQG